MTVRNTVSMVLPRCCGIERAARGGPGTMPLRSSYFRRILRLAAAAALAAVSGCVVSDLDPPPGQPSFYRSLADGGAQLDPAAAASMISGYRSNNGLGGVSLDPELMKLAEEQARAMASRNKLDHDVVRRFPDRLKSHGYRAKTAAENIAAGHHTLAEAFSGWRGSPGHRANMLLKGATRMGIAAVHAPRSKYKVFWALILAAPEEQRG
jgi:uncharacterized protein YkwD